jgi:hypothetical protein
LIELPHQVRCASVADLWEVWNGKLRRGEGLDQWHQGLIKELGDGFNEKTGKPSKRGWGSKWIKQYRYYRVIGEEIERRLNIGGHTLEEIVARLEVIRSSREMNGRKNIQALVDGIHISQEEKPFNSEYRRSNPNIKDLLDEENY